MTAPRAGGTDAVRPARRLRRRAIAPADGRAGTNGGPEIRPVPPHPDAEAPSDGASAGGTAAGGAVAADGAPAADTQSPPADPSTTETMLQRVKPVVRQRRIQIFRTLGRTLAKAWRDRVLGLAAEAGFWQMLSLPPLLLAVFGTLGYIGEAVGHDVVNRIENALLDAAGHLLTASTVEQTVRPTVDDVLRNGRPDVISIGFVLALWSGSTAMSTYVNTITIAYGERDARSAVRSRLLALRLYIAQLVTGIVLLPALVLGPHALDKILSGRVDAVARTLIKIFYWPTVGLLSIGILTSLYHLSVPHRRPWRQALPGAVLALGLWLVGSFVLRRYVSLVFGHTIIYGTLAAPAAVLLFFYITALAVLLGAELNATIDAQRRERQALAAEPQ